MLNTVVWQIAAERARNSHKFCSFLEYRSFFTRKVLLSELQGFSHMLLHKRKHQNTPTPSSKNQILHLNTGSDLSIPPGFEGFSMRSLLAGLRTGLKAEESRLDKIRPK